MLGVTVELWGSSFFNEDSSLFYFSRKFSVRESDLYSILLVANGSMFIFVIVVYIATIVFTHTAVFLENKRYKRRLQTEQLPDEEAERLKKNHKAAETLAIILTALFFSYLAVTFFFQKCNILR